MNTGLLLLRLLPAALLTGHATQKLFGWFRGAGPAGSGALFETWGFRPGRTLAIIAGCCELTGAASGTTAALTADRSSSWRASEMTGLLIRGTADVFARGRTRTGAAMLRRRISKGEALFRIDPARIVWWKGWSSGTVTPSKEQAETGSGRAAKRAAAAASSIGPVTRST